MGLFTPKYPKSDTPGATSAPAKRESRGINTERLRSIAHQQGVDSTVSPDGTVVEVREQRSGRSRRYRQQRNGSWTTD
ncbi:hypothetical protein ACFC08_28800 [Streptomyces sp. NPDC056112]|uniref:hypothetical protein n=1 Tax=Streptomyces sp. NPDC056112 TaxID=3345715 RepID=UPI0035E21ACF